ncbi:hypothetical protein HII31_08022 [Pseudocercospora fuligena]|uniref:Uncharacterized protein n=1 Tax=Pseudocercospora fuligena TaxID=685502 RepID=A0A8H6RGT8_9PEZI|nr:hypothetical protein HII31_08022 [Pseudocercospora fuligena]
MASLPPYDVLLPCEDPGLIAACADETTEADQALENLQRYHDGKPGFVVYRVAYGDDARWAEFVSRFTGLVNDCLKYDVHGPRLSENFLWNIQDNREELEGLSMGATRRTFKRWVKSVNGDISMTRYVACIYVDDEVMDSVLSSKTPLECETATEMMTQPAFAKIIDAHFGDEKEESEVDEDEDTSIDKGKADAESDDENEDLGWMMCV